MLKRFFISLLGTVAGLWISLFILIVGGVMLMGVIIGKTASTSTVNIEKKSILYFDLSGDISERYQRQPFFQMIQSYDKKSLTLDEMLRSLALAADDNKIEGLYIKCSGSAMASASREELIDAIGRFKASGKWVIAYADTYSQGDYLIASTADSLFINPIGSIDIHGVGGVTPFFKNMFDKLGVKMQIIKVGTFKSAVEPYILTSMSEPARLQMQQYCDTIWRYVAGTLAENRTIPVENIYAMAPAMISTRQTETYLSDQLVDALKYSREMPSYLSEYVGLKKDAEPRLVTPSEYLMSKSDAFSSLKDHIAVYYAVGDIADSGDEGIVGETVTADIVKLADDKRVKGLVLRVNSPGGSAFASEQIWEALEYFKSKGKPLYVSMGDYAASGGYYISCGADSIFADRTTITGSIGVFGMIPDLSGLVTDKFGVNFSTVETNPGATGISLTQAMTPAQHEAMQKSVENIYELFTSRVAQGRKMSQDAVKEIAEGRVWIAPAALNLGLVDQIGSLDATIGAMAENLGMKKTEVVRYPQTEEKLWEKILREGGSLDGLEIEAPFDSETMQNLYILKQLREMNPIQARMEAVVVK
ncbi:MAG: signal peptide peptidase SppA [Muribaculaceae bacterium]|nr:signal peptide peptidase SppA [Muribaculaceae bacterium]